MTERSLPATFRSSFQRWTAARLDHVLDVEAGLADVELRHRGRGGRPAKLEAALVELEVAGDHAAVRGRMELERPGDRAATSSRLRSSAWSALNARSSSAWPSAKVDRPAPADRSAAAGVAGDLAEDQLRPGEAGVAANLVDDHAGHLAFDPRLLVRSDPRIEGSASRPPMSAPTAIGPDMSMTSLPVSRHKYPPVRVAKLRNNGAFISSATSGPLPSGANRAAPGR